jgi:hypothetical protein
MNYYTGIFDVPSSIRDEDGEYRVHQILRVVFETNKGWRYHVGSDVFLTEVHDTEYGQVIVDRQDREDIERSIKDIVQAWNFAGGPLDIDGVYHPIEPVYGTPAWEVWESTGELATIGG